MSTIHGTPVRAPVAPPRAEARPVEAIYPPPGLHWVGDGFRVAGYFSEIPRAARRLDPFLLLDYHPAYDYAPTHRRRGVGVHPHRGFETVTFAYQGSVAHHDSAGGGGIIGPGDVQWMTAASGILHKEYHEDAYARRGGPFQMVQLWVNLPAAHKMSAPRYQPLLDAEMGRVALPDQGGEVRVVAGAYAGVAGPAKTFSPIEIYDARLRTGGQLHIPLPRDWTAAALVLGGEVDLHDGVRATADDLVVFGPGEHLTIEGASDDAHVLFLGGEPLREPVVQYGPFVMNTDAEIRQAMVDFQRGAFGELED